MRGVLLALAALLAVSCSQMESKAPVAKVRDGELRVPADYKSWPKFLSGLQRPDVKQVREIYVNRLGNGAKEGQPFPNGTIVVMENYKAVETDGKLVKGELAKVFVMGKDEGWGTTAPEGLKNGDWVYAAYDASGNATSDNLSTCRACHIPLDKKDFVHRYDEYFQKRGQAGNKS